MNGKPCPNCSAPLRPFALSCDQCGTLLGPGPSQPGAERKPPPASPPTTHASPAARSTSAKRIDLGLIATIMAIAALIMGWLIVRTLRGASPDEIAMIFGLKIVESMLPQLLVVALVVTPLLHFLPWEVGRPWRAGFFIVAPIVALISVAAAVVAGSLFFWSILMGPWEGDARAAGPWLTMLPALAMGPTMGFGVGIGTALLGSLLLRRV